MLEEAWSAYDPHEQYIKNEIDEEDFIQFREDGLIPEQPALEELQYPKASFTWHPLTKMEITVMSRLDDRQHPAWQVFPEGVQCTSCLRMVRHHGRSKPNDLIRDLRVIKCFPTVDRPYPKGTLWKFLQGIRNCKVRSLNGSKKSNDQFDFVLRNHMRKIAEKGTGTRIKLPDQCEEYELLKRFLAEKCGKKGVEALVVTEKLWRGVSQELIYLNNCTFPAFNWPPVIPGINLPTEGPHVYDQQMIMKAEHFERLVRDCYVHCAACGRFVGWFNEQSPLPLARKYPTLVHQVKKDTCRCDGDQDAHIQWLNRDLETLKQTSAEQTDPDLQRIIQLCLRNKATVYRKFLEDTSLCDEIINRTNHLGEVKNRPRKVTRTTEHVEIMRSLTVTQLLTEFREVVQKHLPATKPIPTVDYTMTISQRQKSRIKQISEHNSAGQLINKHACMNEAWYTYALKKAFHFWTREGTANNRKGNPRMFEVALCEGDQLDKFNEVDKAVNYAQAVLDGKLDSRIFDSRKIYLEYRDTGNKPHGLNYTWLDHCKDGLSLFVWRASVLVDMARWVIAGWTNGAERQHGGRRREQYLLGEIPKHLIDLI